MFAGTKIGCFGKMIVEPANALDCQRLVIKCIMVMEYVIEIETCSRYKPVLSLTRNYCSLSAFTNIILFVGFSNLLVMRCFTYIVHCLQH